MSKKEFAIGSLIMALVLAIVVAGVVGPDYAKYRAYKDLSGSTLTFNQYMYLRSEGKLPPIKELR